MLGALASLPFPKGAVGSPAERLDHNALSTWFRERGIETWFNPWPRPGDKVVRVSAQLYNSEEQYQLLASALGESLRGD
jgi:isopenicillin-N epimerase